MHLEKYHALGNDFLVLLDLAGGQAVDGSVARALCDRHRGVGADGLVRVTAAPTDAGGAAGADVAMELFNADGGRAEMTGNGIRCLAQAVFDAGLAAGPVLVVHTDAGVRRVTADADGRLSVDMGRAVVDDLTCNASDPSAYVDVGNPHLVMLDGDRRDLAALGATNPNRNVELVAAGPGNDNITVRVWERGVGETQSCGTGACAAAVAARRWGLAGDRVTVHQPGGDLEVTVSDDGTVTLTGPVERVGSVDVPLGAEVAEVSAWP